MSVREGGNDEEEQEVMLGPGAAAKRVRGLKGSKLPSLREFESLFFSQGHRGRDKQEVQKATEIMIIFTTFLLLGHHLLSSSTCECQTSFCASIVNKEPNESCDYPRIYIDFKSNIKNHGRCPCAQMGK